MRTLNFAKLMAIIAFLGLAGFSCFWTAESLYIWQPSITLVGAWLIAISFYLMASICFSKLLRTLDRNEYFGGNTFGRGGHFLLALIGFIVFWVVSLATNTHTLLYRASIKSVITTDLSRTQGYLQGLKDNNVEIKKIEEKYNSKKKVVDALIARFIFEIDNPSAIGIGPRFNTILAELNAALGTTIQEATNIGSTRTQWLGVINYYQKQAYEHLALFRAQCNKEIDEIKRMMNSDELINLIDNHKIALSDINNMHSINNEVISMALGDLSQGYSYIKTNSQYIAFKIDSIKSGDEIKVVNDEERYTREGAIPEAQEMLAIDKVWRDFMTTDKYDGHGFIWWVFIAILVDVAGFILFSMTFGKKEE